MCKQSLFNKNDDSTVPMSTPCQKSKISIPQPYPSLIAQYTCLAILIGVFNVWVKYTFVSEEDAIPTIHVALHNYRVPLLLTCGYLVSLPTLKQVHRYLSRRMDVKEVLQPCMVWYNVAQVLINLWMVYRFIRAVTVEGHPFIGNMDSNKCVYVVWVHYTNKYLEFLDTVFMVLRGKMDQVSFLHVYHHCTIAWAWWIGLSLVPGGDSYFGALLNSWIHVMMYAYYAMSLLKIPCPWKRYLTLAQLAQFSAVVLYSVVCVLLWTWKYDNLGWQPYVAVGVQVWEMVSLFALFSIFYKKSYGSKRGNTKLQQQLVPSAQDGLSTEDISSRKDVVVCATKDDIKGT